MCSLNRVSHESYIFPDGLQSSKYILISWQKMYIWALNEQFIRLWWPEKLSSY